MKLKELKEIINGLSEKELEQDLIYNSEDNYTSGTVLEFTKAKQNLYYTGEDDPASLYTYEELIDQGWEKDEIEGMEIEIAKGQYYLSL